MKVFLPEDKIHAVLAASTVEPRDHALLHVMASTGFRISDVLRLKVAQVASATVVNGHFKLTVYGEVKIAQKKTGKRVVRRLRPDAREAIRKYLAGREYGSPWLFPGRDGNKPLTRMQGHRVVKRWLAVAIPEIERRGAATHTLRRSVAKLVSRQEGLGPASAWLGHDTGIGTTAAYIDMDDLEARAERAVQQMRW
jgi:integrase/recombinase XerD